MRHSLILLFVAAIAAAVPVPFSAASLSRAPEHLMMVVSKGLPGITLYDADTERVICRALVGVSPHEAAFSRDGRLAYVPVYGSTSVGIAGTDEHQLHFIQTSDCKDSFVLDTGEYKRPHGIAVGKSGMVYVTAETAKSLLLIDPQQHRILGAIPTGSQYSHMIAVTADERKVFVSNVQSKTVSVLDVPGRKLTAEIPTGVENQRMTLSPDQQWFVTSLGQEHKVAFYRTSDNQVAFTILIEGVPFVTKFSSDGRYLYAAGLQDHTIHAWKIDVAQKKVVATLDNLGSATGALAVNPFSGKVYVSDGTASRITEIDPESWKQAKVLSTDKTPDAILFAVVR